MGQPTLRVLVTNDDGISSEGIRHLALVAQAAGLDVVVAAPRDQASGSSASLTAVEAEGRILVEDRHLDGLDGVPTYAVAATPGFIALIATRGAFGRAPDVVMSGINRGANTGTAILHSGTVGAALTAGANGCRALAVSLAGESPTNWQTAANVTSQVLPHLLAATSPLVFNVNVPDVAANELRGIRRAHLARFGVVQTTIAEVGKGYVTLGVKDPASDWEPGSDATLVAQRFATLTPLIPICEADDVPLPGVPLPDDSENHMGALQASSAAPPGGAAGRYLGSAG